MLCLATDSAIIVSALLTTGCTVGNDVVIIDDDEEVGRGSRSAWYDAPPVLRTTGFLRAYGGEDSSNNKCHREQSAAYPKRHHHSGATATGGGLLQSHARLPWQKFTLHHSTGLMMIKLWTCLQDQR